MKKTFLAISIAFITYQLTAQHEHHKMMDTVPKNKDTMHMNKGMNNMKMDTMDHSMLI
jgi:hypothetical protein